MREQILFYAVFLSQVVLISFYFPRVALGRLQHVVETYPPASYPKLYPMSMTSVERARGTYKVLNLAALGLGLALVFIGLYAPSEEMLNWDSSSVLTAYFFLQAVPMMIAGAAGATYVGLMRKADSRTTRNAELRRRRLFDFVSPGVFGLAIAVYVGFALFIVYLRQFGFPWFGGYWNIVGMTAMNLAFASIIVHAIYGKKKNPHQAHEDRMRDVGMTVRSLVWVSILATLFVTLSVTLSALDLKHLEPISLSLYFQVLAIISFRGLRIDDGNFEVYRQDPLTT